MGSTAMPATKHDYGDTLGTLTQHNFEFLRKLWDPESTLKRDLLSIPDENQLRRVLKDLYHVIVDDDVRIVIMDIENCSIKKFVDNPQNEKFYALVLPPKPRAFPQNREYQKMQGWNAAHYHAINDSYGM